MSNKPFCILSLLALCFIIATCKKPSYVTDSTTVPGAPTIGTATAGNGQATVTFAAPASNGGSVITGYTVTSSPGGFTGTGSSSPITVTGLTNGTAYTFTVTASNAKGTSRPSSASNSVTPLVTDRDGNAYNTVTIGTQVWLKENLKTTQYNDGTSIPNVADNSIWSSLSTDGYCWYNNDAASNKVTYGALYNWYTVNSGKLCPAGWHVPTDAEWTTLTDYLGGQSAAGGKLKETGTAHWSSPNTGATNESGFTALPAGYRSSSGLFDGLAFAGLWWSSTNFSAANADYWSILNSDNMVYLYDANKKNGFYVRCLRD